MKYRRLTDEELNELEKEFINFLVVNTVTADDWVKLKENDPMQAEEYIEQFSDMVLDKVLGNIKFLEHRSEKELMVFQCLEDKLVLIGLTVGSDVDVDLNNEASLTGMVLNSVVLEGKVKIFRNEKPYSKDRTDELFEMLQSGCLITDEKIFETIQGLF